jgi:hypothetical protein
MSTTITEGSKSRPGPACGQDGRPTDHSWMDLSGAAAWHLDREDRRPDFSTTRLLHCPTMCVDHEAPTLSHYVWVM